MLKNEKTIDEKATSLINLANDHGGEDNITLIIIEFQQIQFKVIKNDDWKKNKWSL